MPITEQTKGVRLQGAVVNLAVAAAANAQPIFQQSNILVDQIGTKSFRLKRIKVRNNIAGNDYLHIGTGVGPAFGDAIPPLYSVNNMTDDWVEYDVPEVEFFADMMAYPAALPGGGSMDVQVEVEEIG